ncbi:MAG: hypothetical protein A2Z65_13595 [Gallionellales bacterium RIFCSPLOWO2_02_58_13]|nr:MAG: hypothetical protein A2Z65_13595 [Gallionellales bacterium RIFCSPLOWO2_02_58_13]
MRQKEARDLLNEAETAFGNLSGLMKGQSAAVILPLIGCLRHVLIELKQQRGALAAASECATDAEINAAETYLTGGENGNG